LILVAAIVLGIAILGGIVLFSFRLRGGNPPLPLAVVHGLAAGTGLGFLVAAVVADSSRTGAVISLLALGLAACLGFFLIGQHLKGRLIPIGPVFIHILLVLLGYAALLGQILG
jgi:hypothetical protein